jgi:RecJ-like exonuclease
MECPDCKGKDRKCQRCNGAGEICDVCGEATNEPGQNICNGLSKRHGERSCMRNTNTTKHSAQERLQRTYEKYQFKRALIEEWEHRDSEYVRRLTAEASKLQSTLRSKGVIE